MESNGFSHPKLVLTGVSPPNFGFAFTFTAVSWYPVALNGTQYCSLYRYTQIADETGITG